MTTDKTKVLDKIKKCMALGESSNEHEAAAALRQAQKLMEMHGLTQMDVKMSAIFEAEVDLPVQAGKNLPMYITRFIWLVEHVFGVRTLIEKTLRQSDYSFTLSYCGPKHRVESAVYVHTVVWRQMQREWLKYKAIYGVQRGPRGERSAFFIGFVNNIQRQVQRMAMTQEESDLIDAYVTRECSGRDAMKTNEVELDRNALLAGASAGQDFKLHAGVGKNADHAQLQGERNDQPLLGMSTGS